MTRTISPPCMSPNYVSVMLLACAGGDVLFSLCYSRSDGQVLIDPVVRDTSPTPEELCLMHKQLAKGIEIHKKLREMLDAVEPVEVPDARGD